jgi:hypothetical protein
VADQYLDALIEKLEALQEETEEVDVEYSVSAFSPFVLSMGGIELSGKIAKQQMIIGRCPHSCLPPQWYIRNQQATA